MWNHGTPSTSLRTAGRWRSIMIWAGILYNKITGPVKVPEGVKITSVTYCAMLQAVFLSWLKDASLSRH